MSDYRKQFSFLLGWGALFVLSVSSILAGEKPNILFILTDDLGYHDLGSNGSDLYRTPNLDRLAQQGTRFTQGYTAAHVCSPTRASIMTGKYPARLRLTDWLNGSVKPYAKLQIPDWNKGLPDEEVTLAELLKPQGYVTGWFGKWHLGKNAISHGFDAGKEEWELNRKKDQEDPKGVFTVTRDALSFIDEQKGKGHPFFVAVSHYSPHGPVRFEENLANEYQALIDQKQSRQTNAGYAAMIEALDTSIGQLLDGLEQRGLSENTLIIFFSDNGGELNFTNNAPLRGGKGMLYEGGIRVPLIARWPGTIPSGKTNEAVISSVDFFPTFAALTGATLPENIDGINVLETLKENAETGRDTLYWHYPHYHAEKPAGAIRKGDWKLIEWFETGETELFHLAKDPNEQRNLAKEEPQKNAELLADLHQWRKRIQAQLPAANPEYDPELADLNEGQLRKKLQQEEKAKQQKEKKQNNNRKAKQS